jgi:hypothetical protein
VFSKSDVKRIMNQYVMVQLYTDKLPKSYEQMPESTSAEENLKFRDSTFGTAQLPLYVVLTPTSDGKFEILDTYEEGKINDVEGFKDFLREPLKAKGVLVAN